MRIVLSENLSTGRKTNDLSKLYRAFIFLTNHHGHALKAFRLRLFLKSCPRSMTVKLLFWFRQIWCIQWSVFAQLFNLYSLWEISHCFYPFIKNLGEGSFVSKVFAIGITMFLNPIPRSFLDIGGVIRLPTIYFNAREEKCSLFNNLCYSSWSSCWVVYVWSIRAVWFLADNSYWHSSLFDLSNLGVLIYGVYISILCLSLCRVPCSHSYCYFIVELLDECIQHSCVHKY